MSTLMHELNNREIHSRDDLKGYFSQFAKPPSKFRVGLEAEFLAVDRESGKALPFSGSVGIESLLNALAERFQYERVLENARIIGLKRPDLVVSLEPGGQVELSAPPVFNVFEIEDQIQLFISQLKEITTQFPSIRFLTTGIHPFSKLDEIEWVPKRRYDLMSEYFKTHGALSHHMMKRTATNQVNVDYLSEENAMKSLRVALSITSIVTAMFSNSSFSRGTLNGYHTERLDIWNQTDEKRAGLISQFTRPDLTFENYLDYLFDMPMIFIIRQGQWIPMKHQSFAQYLKEGYEGNRATLGDFELHLSTAFPEARIKSYLEVRGVDCQEPELIPAVAAFWKGILYDQETADQVLDLVSFASESERIALHGEVAKLGLRARLGSKPVLDLARELVALSCRSLGKQNVKEGDRDECAFLERIREKITRPGKSPAEQLLEKWSTDLRQDPQKLLDYLSI